MLLRDTVEDDLMGELGVAYLAGPMQGYPGHNFDEFDEATLMLRGWGVQVSNPAEFGRKAGVNSTWQTCMRHDLSALLACDSVVTLPGWRPSAGASLEVDVARRLGMPVFELEKRPVPGCLGWALVARL